jgi:hypothetical protein
MGNSIFEDRFFPKESKFAGLSSFCSKLRQTAKTQIPVPLRVCFHAVDILESIEIARLFSN